MNAKVATRLRKAADAVEESAVRGFDDDVQVDYEGMIEVSYESFDELRKALNACLGKSEFYADESR